MAENVVTKPGGIASGDGATGPRAVFPAGVQFSITDPAFGKVCGSGRACEGLVGVKGDGEVGKQGPFGLSRLRATCAGAVAYNPSWRPTPQHCPHALHSAFRCFLKLTCTSAPPRLQVSAFDGPADPMLVTSKTPGATDGASPAPAAAGNSSAPSNTTAPAASPSSSSSADGCRDVPTPDGHSCQQQKDWGKCSAKWVADNGYCKNTCGKCGGSGGSKGPAVQAYSGPAPSGRKMLMRQR